MAKVRVKDTDIERILGELVKPFWKTERYKKNVKALPGKPDIVFPKSRVAVFADGDFWHGRDFVKWRRGIPDFWKKKIALNMDRDARQTKELRKRGYRILRFWGSAIKKRPERIRQKIDGFLTDYNSRKRGY